MAEGRIKRSTPNSQWFKNVARSMGASATDIITEIAPSSSEFVSTNSTFLTNAADNFRGDAGNLKGGLMNKVRNNKHLAIGKDAIKNALDDIKTGKINNVDRETEQVLGELGDLGDFDFGDEVSSGKSESKGASVAKPMDMKPTITAVNRSATLVSNSIQQSSKAALANTNTMVKAGEKNTASIVRATSEHSKASIALLGNIDNNISKLVSFQSETMSKYVGASIEYYDQSLKSMNITLQQMQKFFNQDQQQGPERRSASEDVFLAGGGIDVTNYVSHVRTALKNEMESNPIIAPIKMMFDDKESLKMLAANPLAGVSKMMVNKVMPEMMKQSMRAFDKSFSNFFPALFMKLNRGTSDTGNPILDAIGNVLGVKTKVRREADMGKYQRGAIPFDGETKKAITEVIPTYLRKILASVSGEKELAFGYGTGKWDTVENMKARFNKEREDTMTKHFTDFTTEIKDITKAFQTNEAERIEFTKRIDKFFLNLAENGNGANVKDRKSMNNVYDFEGDQHMQKLFQNAILSMNKSAQMDLMGNSIYQARNSENKFMDAVEKNSLNSNANLVFSNLVDDKNIDKATGTFKKGTLFNPKDKFGFNNLDYLRQIKRILLDGITVFSVKPKGNGMDSAPAAEIGEDPNRKRLREMKLEESRASENDRRKREQEDRLRNNNLSVKQRSRLSAHGITGVENYADLDGMANDQMQAMMKAFKKTLDSDDGDPSKKKKSSFWGWVSKFAGSDKAEKGQMMQDKLDAVLQAPAKLIGKALNKADSLMYNVVFGDPGKDSKGSIMDRITSTVKNTFADVGEFAKTKVFGPMKEFFTGENGIFNQIKNHPLFKENKASKLITSAFGEKGADGKRTGGFMGVMGDEFLDIGSQFKYMISGKGYTSRTGKTYQNDDEAFFPSLNKMVKSTGASVKKYLFGDKDAADDVNKKGIATGILNTIQTGMNNWSSALFGKEIAKGDGRKKASPSELFAKVKQKMPGAVAKGVVGAGIGMGLASGLGILGSIFLPGATAALLGGVAGMATQSNSFMDTVFGKKNERHERMGGLVSKSTQEFFSKNKNVMIGGGVLGTMKGMLGFGLLPAIFGGPVAGAALGVAGSMIYRSNAVQNMLFGKMDTDTGKRLGGLFNKASDMKTKTGKKFKDLLPNTVVGTLAGGAAGVGFSALIGNFGLLGAMLSPLGPIGGAALGLAGGIALSSKKFNRMLFGDFSETTGKKEGGVLQKMSNFFSLEVASPFKIEMQQIGLNMKKWFVQSIANPFKDAIAPMRAAMNNMVTSVGNMFKSGWNAVQGTVKQTFEDHVGKPFGEFMRNNVADPLKKFIKKIVYGPAGLAGKIISAPVRALGFAGRRVQARHERKGVRSMRKNMWSLLGDVGGRSVRGERLTLGGLYDQDGDKIDEGFLGQIKRAYFDKEYKQAAKYSEQGAYYATEEQRNRAKRDRDQMSEWEKQQALIDEQRDKLAKYRKMGAKADYDNVMKVTGSDGKEREIDVRRFYNISKFGSGQQKYLQRNSQEANDYTSNFQQIMGVSLAELVGDKDVDVGNMSRGQKKMVQRALKTGLTGNALRRKFGIKIQTNEEKAAEEQAHVEVGNRKVISDLPDTIRDAFKTSDKTRSETMYDVAGKIISAIKGEEVGLKVPKAKLSNVSDSASNPIGGNGPDLMIKQFDNQFFGASKPAVSRSGGLLGALKSLWTTRNPLPVQVVGIGRSDGFGGGNPNNPRGGGMPTPEDQSTSANEVINGATNAARGAEAAGRAGIGAYKGIRGGISAMRGGKGFKGGVSSFKASMTDSMHSSGRGSALIGGAASGSLNVSPTVLSNGSIRFASMTGALKRNDPSLYGGESPFASRRSAAHIMGERAEQTEIVERATFRSSNIDLLSQIEYNTRRSGNMLESMGKMLTPIAKGFDKMLDNLKKIADVVVEIPGAVSDAADRIIDKLGVVSDDIISAIEEQGANAEGDTSDGGGYGDGSGQGSTKMPAALVRPGSKATPIAGSRQTPHTRGQYGGAMMGEDKIVVNVYGATVGGPGGGTGGKGGPGGGGPNGTTPSPTTTTPSPTAAGAAAMPFVALSRGGSKSVPANYTAGMPAPMVTLPKGPTVPTATPATSIPFTPMVTMPKGPTVMPGGQPMVMPGAASVKQPMGKYIAGNLAAGWSNYTTNARKAAFIPGSSSGTLTGSMYNAFKSNPRGRSTASDPYKGLLIRNFDNQFFGGARPSGSVAGAPQVNKAPGLFGRVGRGIGGIGGMGRDIALSMGISMGINSLMNSGSSQDIVQQVPVYDDQGNIIGYDQQVVEKGKSFFENAGDKAKEYGGNVRDFFGWDEKTRDESSLEDDKTSFKDSNLANFLGDTKDKAVSVYKDSWLNQDLMPAITNTAKTIGTGARNIVSNVGNGAVDMWQNVKNLDFGLDGGMLGTLMSNPAFSAALAGVGGMAAYKAYSWNKDRKIRNKYQRQAEIRDRHSKTGTHAETQMMDKMRRRSFRETFDDTFKRNNVFTKEGRARGKEERQNRTTFRKEARADLKDFRHRLKVDPDSTLQLSEKWNKNSLYDNNGNVREQYRDGVKGTTAAGRQEYNVKNVPLGQERGVHYKGTHYRGDGPLRPQDDRFEDNSPIRRARKRLSNPLQYDQYRREQRVYDQTYEGAPRRGHGRFRKFAIGGAVAADMMLTGGIGTGVATGAAGVKRLVGGKKNRSTEYTDTRPNANTSRANTGTIRPNANGLVDPLGIGAFGPMSGGNQRQAGAPSAQVSTINGNMRVRQGGIKLVTPPPTHLQQGTWNAVPQEQIRRERQQYLRDVPVDQLLARQRARENEVRAGRTSQQVRNREVLRDIENLGNRSNESTAASVGSRQQRRANQKPKFSTKLKALVNKFKETPQDQALRVQGQNDLADYIDGEQQDRTARQKETAKEEKETKQYKSQRKSLERRNAEVTDRLTQQHQELERRNNEARRQEVERKEADVKDRQKQQKRLNNLQQSTNATAGNTGRANLRVVTPDGSTKPVKGKSKRPSLMSVVKGTNNQGIIAQPLFGNRNERIPSPIYGSIGQMYAAQGRDVNGKKIRNGSTANMATSTYYGGTPRLGGKGTTSGQNVGKVRSMGRRGGKLGAIGKLGGLSKGFGGKLGGLGKGIGKIAGKSGGLLKGVGKIGGMLGKNALRLGGAALGGVGIAAMAGLGAKNAVDNVDNIFDLKEGEKATAAQKKAAGVAGGVVGAIPFADMIDAALGGKVTKFIADVSLKFGKGFDSVKKKVTEKMSSIKDAIVNPVKDMYTATKEKFSNAKKAVTSAFGKVNSKIASVVKGIYSTAKGKFDSAKKAVTSSFGKMYSKISNVVKGIYSTAKGKFDSAKKAVSSAFGKVNSKIASVVKSIYNTAKSKFDSAKKAVTSNFGKVYTKVSAIVKSIYNTAKSKFDSAKKAVTTQFGNMYNKVSSTVKAIYTTAKSKFDSAKTAVTDKFNAVKDTVTNKSKEIYEKVKGTFVDAVSAVKDKFGSIVSTVRTKAEEIVSGITGPIGEVASTISSKFAGIKSKAASLFEGITGGGNTGIRYGSGKSRANVSATYGAGDIDSDGDVYYSQNDSRWANRSLAGGGGLSFGDAGCGPTAASMLVNSVQNNYGRGGTFGAGSSNVVYGGGKGRYYGRGPKLVKNPKPTDALAFAQQGGYVDAQRGTRSDFFSSYSAENGIMTKTQDNPTGRDLTNELARGNKVVLHGVGGRNYTSSGHYIVATGLTNTGKVKIKDPLNRSRNGEFDASQLTNHATTAIVADGGMRGGYGAGLTPYYGMGGEEEDTNPAGLGDIGLEMEPDYIPEPISPTTGEVDSELYGSGGVSGLKFYNTASKYIGWGYKLKGNSPDFARKTFDCSSLVQYNLRKLGIRVRRTTREQWYDTKALHSGNASMGDLVFFGRKQSSNPTVRINGQGWYISHVGIVGRNGNMLNAQFTGGVRVSKIPTTQWGSNCRIIGYRRISGITPGALAGVPKAPGDALTKKVANSKKASKAVTKVSNSVKKLYKNVTTVKKTLQYKDPYSMFGVVLKNAAESVLGGKKISTTALKSKLYSISKATKRVATSVAVSKKTTSSSSDKSSSGTPSSLKNASKAKIKLPGKLKGYETAIKQKITQLIPMNEGGGNYFYAKRSGIVSGGVTSPDMGIFHWRESTAADVSRRIAALAKNAPHSQEFSSPAAWSRGGGIWSTSKLARFKKFINHDKNATIKAQNEKAGTRVEWMMNQIKKSAPNITDPKQFAVLGDWQNTGDHAYSLRNYRGGANLDKFRNYFKSRSYWFTAPGLRRYRNGYTNRLNRDVAGVRNWKPVKYGSGNANVWGGGYTRQTPIRRAMNYGSRSMIRPSGFYGAGTAGGTYKVIRNASPSQMKTPAGLRPMKSFRQGHHTIQVNTQMPMRVVHHDVGKGNKYGGGFSPMPYGGGHVSNTYVYGQGNELTGEILAVLQDIANNTYATAQNTAEIIIPNGNGGTTVIPVQTNTNQSSTDIRSNQALEQAKAIARRGK